MLWAWLSQTWSDWRLTLHLVKPETVSSAGTGAVFVCSGPGRVASVRRRLINRDCTLGQFYLDTANRDQSAFFTVARAATTSSGDDTEH